MTAELIAIPNGVTNQAFRDVVIAVSAACDYHHRIPTFKEIRNFTNIQPKIITKVMASSEFKDLMRRRGYDFSNDIKLTPEQIWAVSIITDPTNRKPLKDKLSQAGVDYRTYRAWLNQPHFAQYIKEIGERLLGDHVQDVHTRVVERASSGDIQAMRLYYDLIGRTDSGTNKAVQDLSATVRLLLEVITRNVTDVKVLSKITDEISQITAGQSPTAGGMGMDNFGFENIVQSEVIVNEQPIGEGFLHPEDM